MFTRSVVWLLIPVALVFSGCEKPADSSSDTTSSSGEVSSGENGHAAVEITQDSFQQQVLESDQIVLVDCWAPWCKPCLQLSLTIEQIAKDFQGKAVVGKLNIDDAMPIAQQYGVTSIPALLFFKNGELVDTMVGIQEKADIAARLNQLIGA